MTTLELMSLKLNKGTLVHEHCLRMMLLLEKLTYLDVILPIDLCLDIILLSLPTANVNMLSPLLEELIELLRTHQAETHKKEYFEQEDNCYHCGRKRIGAEIAKSSLSIIVLRRVCISLRICLSNLLFGYFDT